jgi:CelD/BcsL family acetyltransferase involved in cellulose biosynthesis
VKVEQITTYEKLVETEKEWNALLSRSGLNIPFFTHQWFDAWWKNFGAGNELNILFFQDDSGRVEGIAPLMISGNRVMFLASHEVTDYCDFIFCENKRNEIYPYLWEYLQKKYPDYDIVSLINIPACSPTLTDFSKWSTKHGWEHEIVFSEVVPILCLPGSYDGFLKNLGRKNRHELRRKKRKIQALGKLRIECITDHARMSSAIEDFVRLHRASGSAKSEFWQKQGMPEFFCRLALLFALNGWVELYTLSLENRLLAALLAFPYGDTLYFYNIAYDKDFSSFSPGFFLFDHAIEQAISGGIQTVDFLRGGEKYKYFFGAKDSKISNLKLKRSDKKP